MFNVVVKEEQKGAELTDLYIVKSEEVTEHVLAIPGQYIRNIENNDIYDANEIDKNFREHFIKEEQLNNALDNHQLSEIKKSTTQSKSRKKRIAESDSQIRILCRMECEICLQKFETFKEIQCHYQSVHETNGYIRCCGKKFHDRSHIMFHINGHLNPKPISATRQYKAELEIRNEKRTEDDALIREYCNMKCEFCSNEFQTICEAKKHYRAVHGTKGYLICCNKRIKRRSDALQHIRFHSNPEEFKCNICDKILSSSVMLKLHIQNHESIYSRSYKCDLCSYSFVKPYILEHHKMYKHSSEEDKKFICDICNKRFITKNMIAVHMRSSHITSNSHVCDICARLFRNKQVLKMHMETHSATNQPKLQCNICSSWLKNKASLRKHLKRHEAVPAECPICKKMYYNVDGHIKFTHRKASHQCAVCGKYLKSALTLKEHTALHTGEDLYKCSYCTRTFKSSANMYSHKKKAHFMEWKKDNLERS